MQNKPAVIAIATIMLILACINTCSAIKPAPSEPGSGGWPLQNYIIIAAVIGASIWAILYAIANWRD